MYDTHSHLNFQAFAKDYEHVVQNSLQQGMFLNIVGSQYQTSRRAVEIAHEFKNEPVYATVGLHPSHLGKNDGVHQWDYQKFKKLAHEAKKVVAIGETGIDYYRLPDAVIPSGREGSLVSQQKQIFLEHIKLAQELKKPLVIHCRPSPENFDAYEDLYDILKNTRPPIKGVIHCFLADWEHACPFLELGLYISFTGIITFKKTAGYLIEAVRQIPLERLMIETDCPYLTPEPYRSRRRNEPLYVKFIAQKLAQIKKLDLTKILQTTTENGKQLFLI